MRTCPYDRLIHLFLDESVLVDRLHFLACPPPMRRGPACPTGLGTTFRTRHWRIATLEHRHEGALMALYEICYLRSGYRIYRFGLKKSTQNVLRHRPLKP
jgi:hypothetical protein